MLIDGHDFTLFKDYDKGKYCRLTFDGKVQYLRARVELILLNPLRNGAPDLLQNSMGLIMTTAVCAGISAAGTYLAGRRARRSEDKKFFTNFVVHYMDKRLQQSFNASKMWAEWLYEDVRCGLAHAFTIDNGGIEVQVTNYVELKQSGPEIHPVALLEDFAQGWSKYLDDVRQAGPGNGKGAAFEARFDEVFYD